MRWLAIIGVVLAVGCEGSTIPLPPTAPTRPVSDCGCDLIFKEGEQCFALSRNAPKRLVDFHAEFKQKACVPPSPETWGGCFVSHPTRETTKAQVRNPRQDVREWEVMGRRYESTSVNPSSVTVNDSDFDGDSPDVFRAQWNDVLQEPCDR